MNTKPNISGINRYWKRGEDDRMLIARKMNLDPDLVENRTLVDKFLNALLATVKSRRRTKLVGFGVFEWKEWNNRLPTGERVETWRLTFKPGRYVKGKYHGNRR